MSGAGLAGSGSDVMNAAPIVSDEAANEESVQWSQWSPELDNCDID